MTRTFTLVALHAHPDDESLLTGGTLARAAAEGHRVVLVTATLGEAGGPGDRRAELHRAAERLGCARVALLGFHDSGLRGDAPVPPGGPPRFADVPVDRAAAGLIAILGEEHADVLTGYDAGGGYGHPDHRQVHRVARYAAAAAGTPVLLEATVDRRWLRAGLGLMRPAGRFLPRLPLAEPAETYAGSAEISHVIDVRGYRRPKQAALRAHVSQSRGGAVGLLGRLPGPLFGLVAGREWFIEPGRRPGRGRAADVFGGLLP